MSKRSTYLLAEQFVARPDSYQGNQRLGFASHEVDENDRNLTRAQRRKEHVGLFHVSSFAALLLLSMACENHDKSQAAPGGAAKTPVTTPAMAKTLEKKLAQLPLPIAQSVKATGQLGPGRGTLVIDIKAPRGAKLTEGAPFRVSATGMDLTFPHEINTALDLKSLPVRLPLDVADGAQGPVELDLAYYYCTTGDDSSCRPERARLQVEVDISGSSAGGEVHLVHEPSS